MSIIMYKLFIGLFVILFFFKWLKKKWLPVLKGSIGEKSMALLLHRLPENRYKVINNIMLRTSYGTTQIDHIIVSVYGIFVIETKNYKGWINGSEWSEQWTQNIYGHKHRFKNPIVQNYGHIKALQHLLKEPSDSFISIVAFPGDCNLNVYSDTDVVTWGLIIRTIKSYRHSIYNMEQVERFAETIVENNVDSKEIRKEHVKEISYKEKNRKRNVARDRCPRCGGTLVKRQGQYGKFYGCSNFPKCRYTKNK